MLKLAIATTAILFASVGAFALPAANTAPTPGHKVVQSAKAAPKVAKAAKLICPVTGETIADVHSAAGSSTVKGKTYYFCCGGCKPMFDKDPSKYIKSASAGAKAKPGATHKM